MFGHRQLFCYKTKGQSWTHLELRMTWYKWSTLSWSSTQSELAIETEALLLRALNLLLSYSAKCCSLGSLEKVKQTKSVAQPRMQRAKYRWRDELFRNLAHLNSQWHMTHLFPVKAMTWIIVYLKILHSNKTSAIICNAGFLNTTMVHTLTWCVPRR